MKKIMMILSLILASSLASAANVAVVDSGTDFSHVMLKGHDLVNPKEIAGNLVDDDRNGKVDDVAGWNFVEGYGKIFFPDHLRTVTPFTYQLFEVIAHQQAGTATPDEMLFWREHVTSLSEPQRKSLLTHLNFYGQYAHSTHCSGIVASLAPEAKILSARVFPDSQPDRYDPTPTGISTLGLADFVYNLLATATNGTFVQVGLYLKERDIAVANYSLGVPLAAIAKQALALGGNATPTTEQLSAETKRIFAKYEPHGRAWMQSSPGTLFVIAAGNDGTDNDVLPTFPASVRMPNAITVAASQDFSGLAKFSNTGKMSVDVAAPGVAVLSSVPSVDHRQILPMSGTSMAAPYVTGVAAHVKDLNSALGPEQIKQILMGTVDLKPWLQDKVVTGGVVNRVRAYAAAVNSRSMSVPAAISAARASVADMPETAPLFTPQHAAPDGLLEFSRSLVF